MRCPYQTRVIHETERTELYTTHFAEDRTEFGKCLENECPFYHLTGKIETCYRAKSEIEK